jgi:DNA polymerase III delta prime subunit
MVLATYQKRAITNYLSSEKGKEALHRYYLRNQEKIKERNKLYRLNNKESINKKRKDTRNKKNIVEFFRMFDNFF